MAQNQPVKLAALEGQFKTERGAPLRIGGIPNEETRETCCAIEIPYGLSLLAFHDAGAEVKGLEAFPRDQWPNTLIVHAAFQIMVGMGTLMMLVALWALVRWWRRRGALFDSLWCLRALVLAAGALVLFPSFYYLFRVFKSKSK